MTHPNCYEQNLGREILYRCCSCSFDTFSPKSMPLHQIFAHAPVELPAASSRTLHGVRVALGLLTWNNENCIERVAIALRNEQAHLQSLGAAVTIMAVDNGSTDTTRQRLQRTLGDNAAYTMAPLCANKGQSVARNYIIDYAVKLNADYLLMLDGDIAPVHGSCAALIDEMRSRPDASLGCVGLYSLNCTDETDNTASPALHCDSVAGLLHYDDSIAWTQYGMFNVKMFIDGVRFDEHPVFQGPGWGFEDEDLGLQMLAKGWVSANTKYFRYGHYRRNSSLRLLDPTLAAKVHLERRTYVAAKWHDDANPVIAQKARTIARHSFPVLA